MAGENEKTATYPYYQGAAHKAPNITDLPAPLPPLDRPQAYIPGPGLVEAANVALLLGKPLLLTGEPGTGKTQFAYALAAALSGPEGAAPVCPVRKFETKSTSVARDLFYTYDSMTAFKTPHETDLRAFIDFQPLGAAILDAFPSSDPRTKELLRPGRPGYRHEGQRRTLVLIDEIDKAPSDFANDILNEIERLYFRVPELGNIGSPGTPSGDEAQDERDAAVLRAFRPIIIMTSNEERGLPDAFLRRCVFYDIPRPNNDDLRKIVDGHLGPMKLDQALVDEAIDLFGALRGDTGEPLQSSLSFPPGPALKKNPSTAELLNWLQLLKARKVATLAGNREILSQTIGALAKTREDADALRKYLAAATF